MSATTYPGYKNNHTEETVKVTYELRYYESKKSVTYTEVFDGICATMDEAVEKAETLTQLHKKRLHIAKVVTVVETNAVVWTTDNVSKVLPIMEQVRLYLDKLVWGQPEGTVYQYMDCFNKLCGISHFDINMWLIHGQSMYISSEDKATLLKYVETLGFIAKKS